MDKLDPGENESAWLEVILAPGSSLGGARPKATVQDSSGALWIAKFPSRNDMVDMGLWEYLIHQLADEAGITVPPARIERLSETGTTFLVKRFDRTPDNRRLHFASAMTWQNSGHEWCSLLPYATVTTTFAITDFSLTARDGGLPLRMT